MVRKAQDARISAMKARIGAEQRLLQRLIGDVFAKAADPQVSELIILEKALTEGAENDLVLAGLVKEEKAREKELETAVEALDVYQNILAKIEGLGFLITARLLCAIQDIRRFRTEAQLKRYVGTFVTNEGAFPRRRAGEVANWAGDARQALYLLSDQWNRRPGSEWGQKLLASKAGYRTKHPHPVLVEKDTGKEFPLLNGKWMKTGSNGTYMIKTPEGPKEVRGVRRYGDGHILLMARWRTAGKFVEWLWREWWKMEGGAPARIRKPKPSDPAPATSPTSAETVAA